MGQKELTMIMSQIRGGIAGLDAHKISQRGAWVVLRKVQDPPQVTIYPQKVTIYPKNLEMETFINQTQFWQCQHFGA